MDNSWREGSFKGPACNLLSDPFHGFLGKYTEPFHIGSRRGTQNCVGDAEHLLMKPRLSECTSILLGIDT